MSTRRATNYCPYVFQYNYVASIGAGPSLKGGHARRPLYDRGPVKVVANVSAVGFSRSRDIRPPYPTPKNDRIVGNYSCLFFSDIIVITRTRTYVYIHMYVCMYVYERVFVYLLAWRTGTTHAYTRPRGRPTFFGRRKFLCNVITQYGRFLLPIDNAADPRARCRVCRRNV